MKKLMQNKEMLVGVIFLVVGIAYFALAFTPKLTLTVGPL